MKRTLVRMLGITCATLFIVSMSVLSFVFVAKASQDSPFILTNQTVPSVSPANLVSHANAQQQLNLSIGLQLRNQPELKTLLREIYTPHSPSYHHFLSPEQFVGEFGPTAEQQQKVIN